MSDQGWLYVVLREDAKTLFRAKTDEQLDAFVEELHQRAAGTPTICDCGHDWQKMHDSLLALDPGGPLPFCLLGGRPLYQGSERQVVLVRPDLVGHVAAKLAEITSDEAIVTRLGEQIHALTDLYTHAADQQAAVVFATEKTS